MSDSGTTQAPSATDSSQPSAPSSSSREHWLPRSLAMLGAYSIAGRVAWSLPSLYQDPAVPWTTKGIATLFVVAVVAPRALKDAVSALGLIRGGSGK